MITIKDDAYIRILENVTYTCNLIGLWQLDQQAAVSLQKQEKDDNNGPTLEAPRSSRHADHDQQYLNSKKSDLPPQAGNNMTFFRFESQVLQVTSAGLLHS